jgi:predicted  nucleic acid-binding Zn-ribbon protein
MKIIERLFELQEIELGPKPRSPKAREAAASIRNEIPPTVLGHYDRLLARGKKGVALVRHGVCSGCRMKLASGIYAALLRDEDIAMCDSCARYLLIAADTPVERAPPVSRKPGRRSRSDKRESVT